MTVFVDKKILTAYEVEDETRCICGGFKNVVHCPRCGSTQCYANKRASPQALLPGAQLPTKVRAFRCKLCSELFSEVDTVNACKAKVRWRQGVEQEQRTNKALEKVPPEKQHKLLKEYLEAHPERRPQVNDPILKKLFEPPVLDSNDESEDSHK